MTAHDPPAIRMTGIDKRFGPIQANRRADLTVPSGEIHALVGENGAGKSTLMRILSGMFSPDGGLVEVNGREVTGWSTASALAAGVGMVHQHFMLVPTLTVAENVVLGQEPRRGLALDIGTAERRVAELSARTGLAVPPAALVSELSVGQAQRVEMLKALYRGARILILDEPTAVLSPLEVGGLWQVLRRLRDDGGTVVLITHKLDEVVAVSDAITVMRAGATIERIRTSDTTPGAIARAMVGRDVELYAAPSKKASSRVQGVRVVEPSLVVRDLATTSWGGGGGQRVESVSFEVSGGEILGIAGVEGNGQTALVEAIAGLARVTSGQILLGDHDITSLTVRERSDLGLSHIPEDRHERGLVLDFSVAENLMLGQQHRFARAGILDRARVSANAHAQITAFDIRPPDPALPVRSLSGGNQQKIVVAREMGRQFTVLVAAQPTRGVDVGASEFIHARLRAARADGKAVLLVSADLDELLALSDRIAVMYGGRIVTVLPRAAASAAVLGPFMTGATGAET